MRPLLHTKRGRYRRSEREAVRRLALAEERGAMAWMQRAFQLEGMYAELVAKSYPIWPIENWDRG